MSDEAENDGVWFVYDGECPLCTAVARTLRLKKDYGTLYLINARKAEDDPLVKEITLRGLDLDEGMVIYADGCFHHGKEALKFMALYSDTHNIFMTLGKNLFSSHVIAALAYPLLRGMRNLLLRCKGVGRIDNLN